MSRDHQHRDAGAVAILTAVLALVMFGLGALVVDLGLARDSRRQAQNTADAAALAAANALYATRAPRLNQPGDFVAAVEAAKSYAAENYGTTEDEWASCTTTDALGYQDPSAGTNCISFNSATYPREVLVVVPVRKQATIFGGLVGYQGVGIGALAQARLDPGGYRPCVFCVLGSDTHDLQNGNLTVSNGNMWFNGSVDISNNGYAGSAEGLVTAEDGSQFLDGGNAFVEGLIGGSPGKFQGGQGQAGQPRIVDPLAALELPFATQADLVARPLGDPCEDGPGIYDGLGGTGGTCELDPGLYVFTGDVDFSGNGDLVANGVTMYFTCGTPTAVRECSDSQDEVGGGIDLSGNGTYTLEAPRAATAAMHPGVAEELYGYAIVYDRNNAADMRMVGNGSVNVGGAIYGASATIDARGNGAGDSNLSSWVIVKDIKFSGNNASLNVHFDATKNPRTSEGDRALVR